MTIGIGITAKRLSIGYHLAGIIPVIPNKNNKIAEQGEGFRFLYSTELLNIAPNFTAIENAVISAVYAGCETVWIVCDYSYIKIIKYIVGEYARDYYSYHLNQDGSYKIDKKRENIVPIFYVPIHPKDKYKKDGIIWNILYCAEVISKISQKISKWLIPNNYFVSFPNGIIPYNIFVTNYHRNKISNKNNTFLSYEGKTVRDGMYLPFTFNELDRKELKKKFREISTLCYATVVEKLPAAERHSGRKFKLEDLFKFLEIKENTFTLEVPWYYNIKNWEEYCNMLGEKKNIIKRPMYVPEYLVIANGRNILKFKHNRKDE